jgi:hypothetical protein
MKKEITARQFSFTTISILFTMLLTLNSWAQQQTSAIVPHLVRFGGVLTDLSGKPLTGTVGVTFALYTDQQAGVPLWLEMQNVVPDRTGHYSVQLGSTKPAGIPTDLFTSGEARWLGVQPEGQAEQPRVLLLSVPYALKAGDSETLGGLPASAFVLAAPPSSAPNNAEATLTATSTSSAPPPAGNVTGSGTLDFIPLWTSTSNIGNSVLFQSGSGSTAKVGINTTTPAATLDVKGTENVEGLLTLPATGAAIATAGKNSQAEDFIASSFNSGTAAAVNQTFQWRAEPAGNNTTTPSGTLNLLFGSGTSSPTETGLKLSSKGLFTFATGQTFPGAGTITGVTTASGSGLSGGGTAGTLSLSLLKTCTASQTLKWNGSAWACASAGVGTITGVTAGTDLTGGGTSGKVTLNLDTTKVPQLNAVNTFTQTQVVNAINPLGAVLQATSPYQAIAGTMTSNTFFTPAILGNASATGTGTTIGVEGLSSTASGYGVYGSNNSSGTGVYGTSSTGAGVSGTSNSGAGVSGNSSNASGVFGISTSGYGVSGQSAGGSTAGVSGVNTSSGFGVLGKATGSTGQGVWGESAGTGFSNGAGSDGVHGVSHSTAGSGVAGVNDAKDATGVYGSDTQGYGFVTDSHVQQARSAGGWVKAMAYIDFGGTIHRCFNSQIAGSAASTVPCGITVNASVFRQVVVDFGFEIDDRFVQVTFIDNQGSNQYYNLSSDGASITNTQVFVVDASTFPSPFYVVVY